MRAPAAVSQIPSSTHDRRHRRIVALAGTLAALALVAGAFMCDAAVAGWVSAHQEPSAVAAARTVSRFSAWPWLAGTVPLVSEYEAAYAALIEEATNRSRRDQSRASA